MTSPWLGIPLDEYEGHMCRADVGQLQVLNELFRRVLMEFSPKSIAVFGCSGGNGFEHIDPNVTERVVGIGKGAPPLITRRTFLNTSASKSGC